MKSTRTRNTSKPEIKARKPRARTIHAVKVVEDVPLSERIGGHIDTAADVVTGVAAETARTAVDAVTTTARLSATVVCGVKSFLLGVGKGFSDHRAQRLAKES